MDSCRRTRAPTTLCNVAMTIVSKMCVTFGAAWLPYFASRCLPQVRNLEGELADYNLAMDKARTSVDPAEVARFQAQLAAHNKESERQIDQIFVERQEREQGVQRLETQIREVRASQPAAAAHGPPHPSFAVASHGGAALVVAAGGPAG